MLTLEQGKKLVKLARDSISSAFEKTEIDIKKYDEFEKDQGVFVTINKHGELRGCIGFPEPVYPLNKAIVRAARSAAFHDPRFRPLEEQELDEIKIELSVLTVPELIEVDDPEQYIDKIEIGRHGLIIRSSSGSGLLLPQVAPEHDMDAKQFLDATCQKAGLNKDAWKDKGTEVYSFEAQIFCEKDGEVFEKENNI